ncbi:O-antigen ligase family protein [Hymenobacter sp. BT175]|uniref:O-antigen ligase family protein n=1 Tax=Hymenobacter translucens TaxID=2886507 RepID=UPI001D0EEF68|nr:O-antigen ligase family protein [Hymenobacter translucens]MCC2548318.1 O-antigen ligase family protein [Hymenobacter translucens]
MDQLTGSVFSMKRVQYATTFFSACIVIGLFVASFFRILPSIGIIGLTLTALGYAVSHRRIEHRRYWHVYAAFTGVFVLHLLSGLNTSAEKMSEYGQDVVLQSPFLLLPLAFCLLPVLPARSLRALWLLFIALTVLAALGSTIYYLFHAAVINQLYLESRVMPTEPDHIRFSLMITLAIAAGVVMLAREGNLAGWRRLVVGAVIFLMLYQHLLAVRSGLATFYALGGLTIAWLVLRKARYKLAGQLALGMVVLPLLSFALFPTFRNKFHNTQEDLSKVDTSKSANNYSLVGRVYSYKVAGMIIRDNPIVGVGKADMEPEMQTRYNQHFPSITNYIKPHNQFLYNLVAYGGLGLLLFLLCFYYPAWWAWPRHAPLLVAQYCIVSLSFLVEYTLETQIGLTYALFFLLLALSALIADDEAEPAGRLA